MSVRKLREFLQKDSVQLGTCPNHEQGTANSCSIRNLAFVDGDIWGVKPVSATRKEHCKLEMVRGECLLQFLSNHPSFC